MKRAWPGLLVAGLFLLLGLGVGGSIEAGLLPNSNYFFEFSADRVGIFTRTGLALGLLSLLITAAWWLVGARIARIRDEERRASRQTRQQFLQRLDHELKNPLTIIQLGITNLQQDPDPDPARNASLTRIAEQAQRMHKLVMDLRLVSELEKSNLDCRPFDLRETLEEAITLVCEAGGADRQVQLDVQQTPWPVSPVHGDADLLLLAFRNLLENALKFSGPDGRVDVRLSEDGRMAIIEVADTGMGVPADELPLIFEELYRGQNARGIPGSGLGLKLVERIVALHEGAVRVRSRLGQGTVFTVRLPLTKE